MTSHYLNENEKLKQIVYGLYHEREMTATKLAGVQNLGEQLQKKDEENKKLKEKIERLETAIARAENRIAQLNMQIQQSSDGAPNARAIVTPGVSKKILEALTRENTKLRLALDHMTTKNTNGADLAVENRDLLEMIMALKEDLRVKAEEVRELQAALNANENEQMAKLNNQVLKLSAQAQKHQRSLNAKQIFCESLVSENGRLKEIMEATKNESNERIIEVTQLKKELGEQVNQPGMKEILDRVYVADDHDHVDGAELQELQRRIDELEDEIRRSHEESHNVEIERDQLREMCQTLGQDITEKENEIERNLARLNSLTEENGKLTQDIMEMPSLREELARVSGELEQSQQVQQLMQESLQSYENDFRVEHEENVKFKRDMEQVNREREQLIHNYERVKNEYFNYRQTVERLYAQAQSKAPAPGLSPFRRQTSGRQDCSSAGREPWQQQFQTEAMRPRGLGMEVFADGGDHTDSPSLTPHPRRQMSQPGQVQCPNCKKSFPHELLESHIRDCGSED